MLYRTLDVSAARYYAWRKQQCPALTPSAAAPWEAALKETFGQHKRCYGTRRLRVELQAQGYRVGCQRLRSTMRRHGLRALQPRAYTPRTTDSTHGLRCAPNRLLDQPKPTCPNQVWVSDITYLPLASGQRAVGLPMRVPGCVYPAGGGVAGARYYARRAGH